MNKKLLALFLAFLPLSVSMAETIIITSGNSTPLEIHDYKSTKAVSASSGHTARVSFDTGNLHSTMPGNRYVSVSTRGFKGSSDVYVEGSRAGSIGSGSCEKTTTVSLSVSSSTLERGSRDGTLIEIKNKSFTPCSGQSGNYSVNLTFRGKFYGKPRDQVSPPVLTSIYFNNCQVSVDETRSFYCPVFARLSNGNTQEITKVVRLTESSPYAYIYGNPNDSGTIILNSDGSNKNLITTTEVTGNQNLRLTASYTYNGITKTASRNVTIADRSKTLTKYDVACPSPLNEGGTDSCKATATYSDGTSADVSSSTTWSSDFNVVTVGSSGQITASSVESDTQVRITGAYTYKGTNDIDYDNVKVVNTDSTSSGNQNPIPELKEQVITLKNVKKDAFLSVNGNVEWVLKPNGSSFNICENNDSGNCLNKTTGAFRSSNVDLSHIGTKWIFENYQGKARVKILLGTNQYLKMSYWKAPNSGRISASDSYSHWEISYVSSTNTDSSNGENEENASEVSNNDLEEGEQIVTLKNVKKDTLLSVNGNVEWVLKPNGSSFNICENNSSGNCLNKTTGAFRSSNVDLSHIGAKWAFESYQGKTRVKILLGTNQYLKMSYWKIPNSGRISESDSHSHWEIEYISPASSNTTITFENRNSSQILLTVEDNSHWVLKKDDFFGTNAHRICESEISDYCLHIENNKLRYSRTANSNSYALWNLEPSSDGFVRIRNNAEYNTLIVQSSTSEQATLKNTQLRQARSISSSDEWYSTRDGDEAKPHIIWDKDVDLYDCHGTACDGVYPQTTDTCYENRQLLSYNKNGNITVELWASPSCQVKWTRTTAPNKSQKLIAITKLKPNDENNFWVSGMYRNDEARGENGELLGYPRQEPLTNYPTYNDKENIYEVFSPMVASDDRCEVKSYGSYDNWSSGSSVYEKNHCNQCIGSECDGKPENRKTNELIPIAKYITEEINTNMNSDKAKSIRNNNNYNCINNYVVISGQINNCAQTMLTYKAAALLEWGEIVFQNNAWDHKWQIKSKFLTERGVKVRLYEEKVLATQQFMHLKDDMEYSFDIWSNIHYGYVGLSVGFSEQELLYGADLAQNLNPLSPDDPKDKNAIKIGFELFYENSTGVSIDEVLDKIYDITENNLDEYQVEIYNLNIR